MAINDKKLLETIHYYLNNGRNKTIESFGLKEETLDRYIREYRKRYGESIDIFSQIRERFSDEELKKLIKNPNYKLNKRGVSYYNFSGDIIRLGIMSDTHIGSNYTDEYKILKALETMKSEGCNLLLHAGDLTEGMSGRDGHVYELKHIGYTAQLKASIELFKEWDKPLKIIAGNHDLWYMQKANLGADIVKEFCTNFDNFEMIGQGEGDIIINGITIKLFHGGDGASYALSYREQKLIDSFTGGEKPGLLITGHTHKSYYLPAYRNVHTISAGTLQNQTSFMRNKKSSAHVGFWIADVCIGDGEYGKEIKYCTTRYYPFYK